MVPEDRPWVTKSNAVRRSSVEDMRLPQRDLPDPEAQWPASLGALQFEKKEPFSTTMDKE